MPKFSKRANELPESPIRKLAPFAEAAKAGGAKVFHLNIGQPDIETPKEFFDAVVNADTKVLAYSPSPGFASLRQEIASYYQRNHCPVVADDVLVTTGASEAISFVLQAVLNAGEEVIVPEPFYANYLSFALGNDGQLVPVESSIDNDFALPSVEQFEAKITERTRAIMICNPGNPTGILYPESALRRLMELVEKHDLLLIADEVYREFVYDGNSHHSVLSLGECHDHVVVVDSVSKRFSACGARVGNIVTKNKQLRQLVLKMAQARLSPPTFGQIGAQAVYGLPVSFYESIVEEYQQRRDVLLAALNKMDGVRCPRVNGAFYAMVELPVDDSDRFCQWMLEEFRYENTTVMMAPGSGFYATPNRGKNQVRIAYVLNSEDLAAAMRCLEKGLEAYPGRLAATVSHGEEA